MRLLSGIGRTAFTVALAAVLAVFSLPVSAHCGKDILVRQIAGYVARRIVCYSKEGDIAAAGQQMGFIKFGSRVDLFLPIGSDILVKEGDKVRACRSVIAKI